MAGLGYGQPGAEQRVVPSGSQAGDQFGRSVDVYLDVAVVGAPLDDTEGINAGAAYVFRYVDGSWTEVQKLTAGVDADDHQDFGSAVSVERDLISVGARWDDEAGNDAGAVYLFLWNGSTWELDQKMLGADAADAFGTAVALGISIPDESGPPEETHLAVGSPFANPPGLPLGQVDLLKRISSTVWTDILSFNDSVNCPNMGGELGTSVAIRGDVLLGGAPTDDTNINDGGLVCRFGRGQIINSWAEDGFAPVDNLSGERFGHAVAVDKLFDEYIAVVAGQHTLANTAGRVTVFDNGPMPQTFTEATAHDYGAAVAVEGEQIAVGAPKDDTGEMDSGAVYLLRRDAGVWSTNGSFQASDRSQDQLFGSALVWRHGTLVVGAPHLGTTTPGLVYFYTSLLFADGFESGDTTAW